MSFLYRIVLCLVSMCSVGIASGIDEGTISEKYVGKTLSAESLSSGSYFDWGRGKNGWGYCYEWTYNGDVLNGGQPVPDHYCERNRPSYFDWGRGKNGWGYCYQWTPYGVAMNDGNPVSNYSCESYRPSYYAWSRAKNGYTYCYQYTADGVAMNEGNPVSEYYCR